MKDNKNIEWNDAIQQAKENKIAEEKRKIEYKKQVDDAYDEFWELLGSPGFRFSDFEDTCSAYGIDEDDLLNQLI